MNKFFGRYLFDFGKSTFDEYSGHDFDDHQKGSSNPMYMNKELL